MVSAPTCAAPADAGGRLIFDESEIEAVGMTALMNKM
jgi:hypothetical protein